MSGNGMTDTLRLTGALLSPFTSAAELVELREMMARGVVDWTALAQLANRSGLAPALAAALSERGLLNEAPEQLRDYLAEIHNFNTARNEVLLAQLAEVTGLLNLAGVTPMLLKGGAALATGLFPDPGSRFMWDLDLLVPEEQLERSVAALRAGGYVVPEKHANHPLVNTRNMCHHAAPMIKEDGAAEVELHRWIVKPKWGLLPPEEIWSNAVPCASPLLPGAVAFVLAPTDELIHCFVHSQLSHANHHYFRIDLRHLHHFAHLCHRHGREIDWRRIDALRHDPTLGRIFSAYLLLANRLFRVTLPLPDEVNRYAVRYFRFAMAVQDGWQRRLHRVWLVIRELGLVFGEERLREAFGEKGSSIMQLRMQHLKRLLVRYSRMEVWHTRLGSL